MSVYLCGFSLSEFLNIHHHQEDMLMCFVYINSLNEEKMHKPINWDEYNQRTLTEGEGSVRLTARTN